MNPVFAAAVMAGGGTTFQVDDVVTAVAIDAGSPYDSTVGFRFLTDGTYEKRDDIDGAENWDFVGNWAEPPERAGLETVHVRFTNKVGSGAFTTLAAAEDAWIEVSATRTWEWNDTGATTNDSTCDIQISLDAGSTVHDTIGGNSFSIDNI